MVGSAFAQPVFGPFQVHLADSLVRDTEVSMRGDSADVIWIENNRVLKTSISLISNQQSEPLLLFSPGVLNSPHLFDAQPFGIDRTTVLLSQSTSSQNSGSDDLHFLAFDQDSLQVSQIVDAQYIFIPGVHASGTTAHGYAMRSNGSHIVVSYWGGSVTIFDIWYSTTMTVLDQNLSPVNSGEYSIQSPWPGNSSVYSFPFQGDSLLLAAESVEGSVSDNFCLFSLGSGWTDVHCYELDWEETADPLNLAMTLDRSLIGLYTDGSFRATTFVDSETVSRETLPASLPDTWRPASAFHPNYGFAAIQALPGYLLLSRIDTSGNEVQPVGVLYETDGTSFIVDADVTISDSGEVIAVWSEYSDWNEGPHVLKIAWTDWTTYLDTPEQQAPAIPSQISLSSYPNPFNSTVTIKYDLPQASRVSLSIFDIQGRLVETILNDFTPSGSHTQAWSPTKLASGVYFARLNTATATQNTKLLYLK